MVSPMSVSMRVGATVRVPWGLDRDVEGTIVEVWGDPPTQVRVQLHLGTEDEDAEPVIILLSPTVLTAA